jgi:hypothetical protein
VIPDETADCISHGRMDAFSAAGWRMQAITVHPPISLIAVSTREDGTSGDEFEPSSDRQVARQEERAIR